MTFRRATTELYMYMSRVLHDMSYVVVEVGWDWTGAECVGVGFLFGSGLNVLLATANEQPTKTVLYLFAALSAASGLKTRPHQNRRS